MTIIVIKRDGSEVAYSGNRIQTAILKASFASGNQELWAADAIELKEQIYDVFKNETTVNIENIQSEVENRLMMYGYHNVARAYIEYRHERDLIRERKSDLNTEILGLLKQNNSLLLTENANKDSKIIPTMRDLLAGIIAKHYAKTQMLDNDIVRAHEAGEIHYHDLDYAPFFPMFNCMLIDLKGMFTRGFKMGNADIVEPRSISTATAVTAQIIAQVASHIYGGTTINNLDTTLAPYVARSYTKHMNTAIAWGISNSTGYAKEQTEKECHNAFQALEYETNTLQSANGQTPFVTFGFGLGISWEARLIQKCIFKNRIAGLGKNRKTAIFPKLIYAIKEGVNRSPQDRNYDIKQLALECATKRMYPDILNFEKVVEVTGSFKTPMGCRSFLGVHKEDGNIVHDGRNNLGVVSLNLPRIALESGKDITKFYAILDVRLALAKKALDTRIDRFSEVNASVAPILYMEGACGVRLKADDKVADIFKNGRASISLGYIGLHETINALFDDDTHIYDSKVKQKHAKVILQHLKDATVRWTEETGYAFSLYATPAENLCGRLCNLDAKQFGIIKGVTDKGYYTNSFHLDVQKKVNPYDKIDFEMPFPEISNGGFICYGEYPNMQNNIKALEDVWDYSYPRVPYYGTNTPIDECYACGFTGEFECKSKGFICPSCGNSDSTTSSVTRRVCGYLGSPDARPFNAGKQEDVKRRVKHL